MPQNTTKNVAAAAWTQLSDANIATVTFQNISGNFVLVKGTVGATAPTDLTAARRHHISVEHIRRFGIPGCCPSFQRAEWVCPRLHVELVCNQH